MTKYGEANKKERHKGFETTLYHIGRGRFIKDRSHLAQHILENFIEMKESTDIYMETPEFNGLKLTNMISNNSSTIEFDFDCNMVLERPDGAVVTGDLKSLEYIKNSKLICARTADSVLCFELE